MAMISCLFSLGRIAGFFFCFRCCFSIHDCYALVFLVAPGYGHLSNRGLRHNSHFLLCVSVIPVIGEVGPGHGWRAHCRPGRGWRWVTTEMVVLGIGAMVKKVGKGLGYWVWMVERDRKL